MYYSFMAVPDNYIIIKMKVKWQNIVYLHRYMLH